MIGHASRVAMDGFKTVNEISHELCDLASCTEHMAMGTVLSCGWLVKSKRNRSRYLIRGIMRVHGCAYALFLVHGCNKSRATTTKACLQEEEPNQRLWGRAHGVDEKSTRGSCKTRRTLMHIHAWGDISMHSILL